MQSVRPISDLRNKFTEISRDVHGSNEPVILTRNGSADMVVMSMKTFRSLEFDSEVYHRLKEAERQAAETDTRYTSEEVLASMKQVVSSV